MFPAAPPGAELRTTAVTVFSPGFLVSPDQYRSHISALTSAGIPVLTYSAPQTATDPIDDISSTKVELTHGPAIACLFRPVLCVIQAQGQAEPAACQEPDAQLYARRALLGSFDSGTPCASLQLMSVM